MSDIMEGHEDTSKDLQAPIKLVEGYGREGLILTTVADATEEDHGPNSFPNIDIVHVMVVGKESERLLVKPLLVDSVASRRREFVFSCDLTSLLAGDFTSQCIDGLARQLLRGLMFFQQHDEQYSRKAVIFVAYDLGDLIVKKAISIAGANERKWPQIFASAARFVFSGCFQRVDNTQLFYSKVFDYLASKRSPSFDQDSSWGQCLTPESISCLARCVSETTEAFVASKITLRSQVISLHANVGKRGKISDIFDQRTATIGLPNEVIFQEKIEKDKPSFPDLPTAICSTIHSRVPYEAWIPFEQTLLAVASPPRPFSSSYLEDSHPVLKSTEHETWMTSTGARILHVRGSDYNRVIEASEQVFLHWKFERRRYRKEGPILSVSFTFSARDPKRCSVKGMISSILVSYYSNIPVKEDEAKHKIIKDQLELQHAWTEMDLFRIFTVLAREFIGLNVLLLLQDIEECDTRSRGILWKTLSHYATTTEVPFKIMVTCRESFNLLDELRQWPDLPVHTWNLADEKSLDLGAADAYPDGLLSTYYPIRYGKSEVRQKLEELKPMKRENLDIILRMIREVTNWPQERSAKALRSFSSHLQAVTLTSTPADILRKTLRDITDQDGLRWALKWIFKGQRPLSYDELAMVLYYCKRGQAQNFQMPSPMDLEFCQAQLRIWLRGIAESVSGQICIREEVRDHLQNELDYISAESTSPDAITTFLLDYLTAPDIQQRLDDLSKQYQSQVQSSDEVITPPLISDGQDIIFYAIQALPYHLSENPVTLKSIRDVLLATDGKLSPWSKAYWAMSNPFSRPKFESLNSNSPYETLRMLGNLKSEAIAILKEMQPSALMNGGAKTSYKPSETDPLSIAVREGNEEVALSIAKEWISASKTPVQGEDTATSKKSSKIAWPSWFLWRAAWLDMIRFATLLLNNGMDPDPADGASKFFPSPLYMASRICHSDMIDLLVQHGANVHVKRLNRYKAIQTASSNGCVQGVSAMLAKDNSLLESMEPETPLYFASLEGCWKVVERLLELGADPNSGIGERSNGRWAPLVVAVESNNMRTAEILLKNKADPNLCGPNDLDTPLWFAATKAASADMVRLLLDNGSDPNHTLLDPPLLIEIVKATVPPEKKIAILEVLINNSIPIKVNVIDSEDMTPLHHAAAMGELSVVTWLLEHGAEINATDNTGCSSLYYAVKDMHVEVIRELLKRKPEVNNLTTEGQPIVEIAIDNVSVMEMLLDAGADIELPNYNDHTVLNIAVDWKKVELVKLLVSRKANIHHNGKGGWNAITIATWSTANAEILRTLIEGGAKLGEAHPESANTPLHFVMAHDAELAKMILEYRKDIDIDKRNNYQRTPLLYAGGEDNFEAIKLLIHAGTDINAEDQWGWTILGLAARRGFPDELANLILAQPELKIDFIGKTKGTALMVACRSMNLDMVKKLLAHGADATLTIKDFSFDSTMLKATCMPWKEPYDESKDKMNGIICELLAHGADINAMGGRNIYNAICAAAFSSPPSTIQLLLDKGASLQDCDPLSRYPIHFAAANGITNFEAVARLHEGDLMLCDIAGKNALHWAAQFGHAETIEAMLKLIDSSGKDRKDYVNLPDVDGWTPLCWATRPFESRLGLNSETEPRDYVKTVKYLIDQGADRSVRFKMGTGENAETFTPWKMAKMCGADDEVVSMLNIDQDASLANGTNGQTNYSKKPLQKYKLQGFLCDICFNSIFGFVYSCPSCFDFGACSKCYGRIDLYHDHLRSSDGEPHHFELHKKYDEEFEDAPIPSTPEPEAENEDDVVEKSRERPAVDEIQKKVEEEVDDLGDLDDLDELDELEVTEDDVASPP